LQAPFRVSARIALSQNHAVNPNPTKTRAESGEPRRRDRKPWASEPAGSWQAPTERNITVRGLRSGLRGSVLLPTAVRFVAFAVRNNVRLGFNLYQSAARPIGPCRAIRLGVRVFVGCKCRFLIASVRRLCYTMRFNLPGVISAHVRRFSS